jgi:hypothetical protein
MALTVILSVIYLLIFGVILWRIQIPKVMIQTGDEIDKMHNEMNVGEGYGEGFSKCELFKPLQSMVNISTP